MKLFIKHAKHKHVVKRSIKVALIVGTILALINQYDAIIYLNFKATNLFQILLTYTVPYCVTTYGAAMHGRHLEKK